MSSTKNTDMYQRATGQCLNQRETKITTVENKVESLSMTCSAIQTDLSRLMQHFNLNEKGTRTDDTEMKEGKDGNKCSRPALDE